MYNFISLSLDNPERKQLEEAMRIICNPNGNDAEYLSARRTALKIARQFYFKGSEVQREMNEVYRKIGESILERELGKEHSP